jgi:ABC-type uncharacterized transport system permease subunit
MSIVEFLLAGTLAAALPLLLAALGEMVVERTGLLNLGLEGMMAIGAAIAFISVFESGSHLLGRSRLCSRAVVDGLCWVSVNGKGQPSRGRSCDQYTWVGIVSPFREIL